MLDFTNVSREIRSLISRRRELLTFLGTVFAAMSIFLQNVLQGSMPDVYKGVKEHGFAYYSFLLLVPSLILSLRLARLNGGMTLNGILYQRLMQEQDFTRKAPPEALRRAGRLNIFGVGFLMSFLTDLIAGLATALLVLSLALEPWIAALTGAGVVVVWLALYVWFHNRAVSFALQKTATEQCLHFTRDQWEDHQAASREDANHDMIAILALVGLIVFSAFEGLSSLGKAANDTAIDITSKQVDEYGPLVYGILMAVTCLVSMVTYIRLRVAIGFRSLDIDPSDRPFRILRLTDSLMGYMLLAFLLVVSLHFLLYTLFQGQHRGLLVVDGVVFVLAVAAEQVSLVVAGRGVKKQ